VYAIDASGTIEGFTIGAHGSYWDINSYPIPTSVPAVGVPNAGQADMYWLGAYADGKYAGFNFSFDFIYDAGKIRMLGEDDVKCQGWLTSLKADFPWENWEFGGGAWYATGAKTDSDKQKAFLTPPGSEQGPNAFVQWGGMYFGPGMWRGERAFAANSDHSEVSGESIGGTWGGFLYAGMKLTPWYKVYLNGLYIGDTTKNGDTVGFSANADGTLKDHGSIGMEFTLTNVFKVYNNLDMSLVASWLIAGKAMDMYNFNTGDNDSPKDPYLLGMRMVYSF
jgi:hypothetical protein